MHDLQSTVHVQVSQVVTYTAVMTLLHDMNSFVEAIISLVSPNMPVKVMNIHDTQRDILGCAQMDL